ncbi:MAG TPA: SDR family NAD(P)-dependent oxidoreductase [Candidatus Lumbricidophila sp.]|nr:SDR family NAD(P)-dependent oxidoreductase [Candidatus Lumbricidophila sp.]
MSESPRIALVTGGAGDIGRAISTRLAADGFTVYVCDVQSTEALASVASQIATTAGVASDRVVAASVDVTDRAGMAVLIASLPRIDVVVANAGVGISAPVLEITAEKWQTQLDINLTGAFNTAQPAAQRMAADGTRGLLLFTSSWIGQIPWPEMGAYSVSKAGLEMLMKSFARELAPRGIRSNAVSPGIVRAGLAKHQLDTEPQYAERVAKVVPLGELGTPEQIADAVSFLASDQAAYMTGTILTVDGGCSLFAFD